jgi:putative ABC transport system ATP-binding protein
MIFEFKHVTKRKPAQSGISSTTGGPIIHDINFTVHNEVPQLILGPSGSGKSTLLRLCNRLSDPDEGEIFYLGKSLRDYDVLDLRTRIGFVSQVPVMLEGTVRFNFEYAFRHTRNRPINDIEFDEEAGQLLRFLNLSDTLLHRDTDELSVGEKQRVALARTLIRKPEILLLDEPASALDPTATMRFLDIIRKLLDEMNVTIIMVTHSIEQARMINGNAIILVNGRIVDRGPVDDILARPRSETTNKFIRGILDN